MTFRILLAGFGAMGQLHARLLTADDRVHLAGAVDADNSRRNAFCQTYSTEAFASLREGLDVQPHAIFITTPNVFHADAALLALERGIAVFCEKPLATTVGDARRVLAAAAAARVLFQVGHNRRFAPAYRSVRQILDGGFRPRSANIIKNDAHLHTPPWSSDPAVTGGLLYDGTIHALDAAMWLLGSVAEVYCIAQSSVYADLDDFAITLRFRSGAVATVSTSGHASGLAPLERVALYGDHSAVVLEDMDWVSWSPGLDQPVAIQDFRQLPFERRWGYEQEVRAFVDALASGGPAAVGVEDGCHVVELIDACYRSANERRPVLLR